MHLGPTCYLCFSMNILLCSAAERCAAREGRHIPSFHPVMDDASRRCTPDVYTDLILSPWKQDISHHLQGAAGTCRRLQDDFLSLRTAPLRGPARYFTASSQVSGGGRAGLTELTLPPRLWLVFGSPSTSKVNICLAGNLCILPSCSLDSSWQIATQRGEGSAAPSHSQFKRKQIEVSAKSTNAKTRQDKKKQCISRKQRLSVMQEGTRTLRDGPL